MIRNIDNPQTLLAVIETLDWDNPIFVDEDDDNDIDTSNWTEDDWDNHWNNACR